MDKKGFWALLASVSKAWKTIFTRTNDSFRYRQAAGDDNILLPEKNGRAVFDKIYGTTVKWNQYVKNGDFSNGTTDWTATNSTISASNNILTQTFNPAGGYGYNYVLRQDNVFSEIHTLFVHIQAKSITNTTIIVELGGGYGVTKALTSNVDTVISTICIPAQYNKHLYIHPSTPPESSYTIEYSNINIIDLTAIFGTDAEIAAALGIQTSDIKTATGVAAFEAWLALNVGQQDYYPYDEGSLISFKGQGVRTIKNNVELDRLDLDVTKIYGKVSGDDTLYQCFPNGMLSASSVSDELTVEKAIVKTINIHLGGLDWKYEPGFTVFVSLTVEPLINAVLGISNKYQVINVARNNLSDKQIGHYSNSTLNRIALKDSYISETDIVSNKIAKLNGVYLYCALATPITYTDLIYSEDNGQTGVPLTDFIYKVDKHSTEELLVPASDNGEPTSTAIVADIEYQKRG